MDKVQRTVWTESINWMKGPNQEVIPEKNESLFRHVKVEKLKPEYMTRKQKEMQIVEPKFPTQRSSDESQ